MVKIFQRGPPIDDELMRSSNSPSSNNHHIDHVDVMFSRAPSPILPRDELTTPPGFSSIIGGKGVEGQSSQGRPTTKRVNPQTSKRMTRSQTKQNKVRISNG